MNNICKYNTIQPKGEYVCCNCSSHIDLNKEETLPTCPVCGNNTFTPTTNSEVYY